MCNTSTDRDAQWWEKYSFTDHGWPTELNKRNIYAVHVNPCFTLDYFPADFTVIMHTWVKMAQTILFLSCKRL